MTYLDEFLIKLAELMEEYNVDFVVEEDCGQYGGCWPTGICIARNAEWDKDHNLMHPWVEVNVGNNVEAVDIRNAIGKGRTMWKKSPNIYGITNDVPKLEHFW